MIAKRTGLLAPLLDIIVRRTQRFDRGRRALLAGASALVLAAVLDVHTEALGPGWPPPRGLALSRCSSSEAHLEWKRRVLSGH